MTPIEIVMMIMVASALISGRSPSLIQEKISIGSVFAPGPVTKLAITRSSSDKVNAYNHPANIPGAKMGNVISVSTLNGFAPKSLAASSIDSFIPVNRD